MRVTYTHGPDGWRWQIKSAKYRTLAESPPMKSRGHLRQAMFAMQTSAEGWPDTKTTMAWAFHDALLRLAKEAQ